MEIKKIAVMGAGLMGHGIAQVAAQSAGVEVYLRDIDEKYLREGNRMISQSLSRFVRKGSMSQEEANAVMKRITSTTSIEEAVSDSDVVIEAAPEREEIKRELFMELDRLSPGRTILASNTSSISITLLASYTNRPEKVCGMHFFNPPQVMRLVEIVRGQLTSDEAVRVVQELSQRMGKETVLVKKDSPGFIVNRILIPALNEAVSLLQEEVATPEDIDKAVRLGLNWPMGPLTLSDYVGNDTTLYVGEVLHKGFGDPKYRAPYLLKTMVTAGLNGRKSRRGFYRWDESGHIVGDTKAIDSLGK